MRLWVLWRLTVNCKRQPRHHLGPSTAALLLKHSALMRVDLLYLIPGPYPVFFRSLSELRLLHCPELLYLLWAGGPLPHLLGLRTHTSFHKRLKCTLKMPPELHPCTLPPIPAVCTPWHIHTPCTPTPTLTFTCTPWHTRTPLQTLYFLVHTHIPTVSS